MNDDLYIDTETFSETPIKHGTAVYTDDVELMVVSWAVGDEEPKVHDFTRDPTPPGELVYAMKNAPRVIAHNAMFDRLVVAKTKILPSPALERWECTMVRALSHSLPGGLDRLCRIFNVSKAEAKLGGKDLIRLFCMPQPANNRLRRATRETHPAEWANFLEYARIDIAAMRAIHRLIPAWNCSETERNYWLLDQIVNERGVQVDMPLINAALGIVERTKVLLEHEIQSSTGGAVDSATQRDELLKHILSEHGVSLPDMRANTIERRLEDEMLPEPVKDLLRIRLATCTTSTSKYKAFSRNTSADGRLRCTLQFCGAARTGRWAARGVQPQNFPRPSMPKKEVALATEELRSGAAELLYPPRSSAGENSIMDIMSNVLRGAFISPPGRKLCVSDLSNIEGRGLVYLTKEEWKLDAFRMFDLGVGEDLYKVAYGAAMAVDPASVDDYQRQIGKVMELALGYAGGVGAFVTFAAGYGLDLEDLAQRALPVLPTDVLDEAEDFYAWLTEDRSTARKKTFGLSHDVFVACDALKRVWRRAHPKTVEFWKDLEDACRCAIRTGNRFEVGRLVIDRRGTWLRVMLPSGRFLCYPSARVEGDGDRAPISYLGINQYTRKFERLRTYSGKLTENATQAFARDILCHGLLNAERAGYQIVLSIHDEAITEVPDSPEFTDVKLSAILATPPSWCKGIPLAASGFTATRYRK